MTPYQEAGLKKYAETELQMEKIEREMSRLDENGESNISLVGLYNSKVDSLDGIVKQYCL